MLNIRKITFLLTLLSTSYKIVGATTHDHDLYFLDDDLACSATKVIAKTIMNNYKENKAGEIF
jgi:hypothetical protein